MQPAQKLTPREARILPLDLREGNWKPVAKVLGMSIHTVPLQRTSIMKNLDGSSQVELSLESVRRGPVDLEERES